MNKQFYFGGTVLTMEDRQPYAEAVLVEDGKIAAVGSCEELMDAAAGAELVDLKGGVLMPGFIDAHSHFSSYAVSLLQPSVEEAVDFKEIQETIRRFLEKNRIPAGKWITVKGFDHNRLREKCPPDRSVLDEVAPDNPLFLQHQSGHTGVFNTKGLEALGVDENTPDPAGGRIERVDGRLTGFMEENAVVEAIQKIPMPTLEELEGAYQEAQRRYAGYGITTMQEGMMMDVMADMLELLCAKKLLRLDLVGYMDVRSCAVLKEKFGDHIDAYRDHFKIGGYKTFLDGSPQARTAWLRQPYENAPDGYRGYPTLTDEQLLETVRRALKEGRQLLAHCNGDAAAQQYLTVFNRALGELDDAPDIRPVMIHAQLLGRDQLPLMKQIGMIPSFFVAHVYHWGDVHIRNFGMERASGISCAHSAQKEGIRFTFHQDAPVIEPDMLETVWCAVNRVTKDGVELGPQERISPMEALKAVTIHAAYQYFEERSKGSIRAGKRADLTVLSADPTKVPAQAIRDIRVLRTIKDGEIVYQA